MNYNNHGPDPNEKNGSPSVNNGMTTNFDTEHKQYDLATISAVWAKATKVYGFYFLKHDHFGRIIAKHDFGKKSEYGWTIVHIVPSSAGGKDDIDNLQPVHWENALSKGAL